MSTVSLARADSSAARLEHLHRTSINVTHAMSTAQLLGQAMATRAIGRSEEQFLRELSICQNLASINFGEARWRLQALDAAGRLEELGYSERLFGILLEAARQWNGTAEEAFNVIEALGVLGYQLEKLSVGLGQMSDEELAALMQQGRGTSAVPPQPTPQASASASSTRSRDAPELLQSRQRNTAWRLDDQNL